MKRFIVGFLAVIGFIVVALAVLTVTITVHSNKHERQLPPHMVLTLSLEHGLTEAPADSSLLSSIQTPEPSLQDIIQTLALAQQDERVKGLAVHLSSGDIGLSSAQELRDAIFRFRRSGKFAYIYADTLGDGPAMPEYWLATSFDQIWLQPLGELAITGFETEMPFGKDLLDKVGVEAQLLHQGKYKSFPEMATRSSISDDNRAMTLSLLGDLQRQFDSDVTQTRQIKQPDLQNAMDASPLTANDAMVAGLIDAIGYRDEFDSYLEQSTKGAEAVEFENYQSNGPRALPGDKIALVNVVGALTNVPKEEATSENVSAEDISDAINDAADDAAIKAIVVRVDSPGGTPLAADMIRRAIQLARAQKPVIVSMSNTAASGGYWMSTDADYIIAQSSTLTGSIGVFGGKVNLSGLWGKLGVHWDAVAARTDNSALWSPNKSYDAKSSAKVENSMARTYAQFKDYVARGRKLSPETVEGLAQGRVWTGAQALQNGLVDALGGLDVAVVKAKEMAKIPAQHPAQFEIFPKPLNPIQQFLQMVKNGVPFHLLGTWFEMHLTQTLSHVMLSVVPKIQ